MGGQYFCTKQKVPRNSSLTFDIFAITQNFTYEGQRNWEGVNCNTFKGNFSRAALSLRAALNDALLAGKFGAKTSATSVASMGHKQLQFISEKNSANGKTPIIEALLFEDAKTNYPVVMIDTRYADDHVVMEFKDFTENFDEKELDMPIAPEQCIGN